MELNQIKVLFLILSFQIINCEKIQCYFQMIFHLLASEGYYECMVLNVEIFNQNSILLTNADGRHHERKNNDNVQAFYLSDALELQKFPTGIDKIFKNLSMISITNTKLKEITKEDLKVFPNLKNLHIYGSQIKILKEDLFENNLKVEVLWLSDNKISHIDSKSFSKLNNLNVLLLSGNDCESLTDARTREKVLKLIRQIEQNMCHSREFI
ncbi:hypothetical protein PVAND_016019 [Polypedilum vanderplanki]|uniref:Uncharacterized protein n=1 Tax=Polypedilum vanderplanki TaxID=319348 RepID=A0A9J6BEL9_POLVA|nr:hypothetical protein PVAND_016019 [Polypedilum vanderplanki]